MGSNKVTGVTTTTSIITAPFDNNGTGIYYVNGMDGNNRFFDVVIASDAENVVVVLSSTTIGGTPAARTYTMPVSTLRLAMASGTYNIVVSCIENAFPG
jgi:hypothetical protein